MISKVTDEVYDS